MVRRWRTTRYRRPTRARTAVARCLFTLASAGAAWLTAPTPARAQDPPSSAALRVFLDCSERFFCDTDFFRREVPFVNYVLDREDAQVHLLILTQETGAGGRSVTLDFIGRETFEGRDDRILVAVPPDVSDEERLETVSRGIAAGLMGYVAQTGVLDRIRIEFDQDAGEGGVATAGDDPWDFWVFLASLRGSWEAEDRQDDLSLDASLSANRVTDQLKIELGLDGEYQEENFDIDDSTTVSSLDRNYELDALVVHSIGDHWSIGGEATLDHSTFRNRERAIRIAPALEFNLFRYADSERKQFTILYTLGFNSFHWREITLFEKTSETRLDHSLRASLSVRQAWGEAGGDFTASHFLDDIGLNRISGGVFLDFRITRGLSVDLRAEASRVRDQINLAAGDATPEEILLERRELLTGFQHELSIGFSYRFGSIFNNVVNPRFDSGF